jgi:DNA invertase Pin-like site-specific DNA recombinase
MVHQSTVRCARYRRSQIVMTCLEFPEGPCNVHKRGAFIKVLDRPGLVLTTPSGHGILALLSGLAEEERLASSSGPTRAASPPSSAGTKLGRRSKLDDHQQQEAIARLKAGESLRTIAKSYRVHHATIGRLAG